LQAGSAGFDTTNPPRSRRVFLLHFCDNRMTRISGDSDHVAANYQQKIQAKQQYKNYITHLLGLRRVNAIYFIFFAALLLIDSFLGV